MARLRPIIKRIRWRPSRKRWLVYLPVAGKMRRDPDRPGSVIVPLSGVGGWAATKRGARQVARRLEGEVAAGRHAA